MQPKRIIISGGGTGGHIFPAIAIAQAIMEQAPTTEILFVGSKGKMEMEKVPAAGFKIEGLTVAGLQRKLALKNISFPFKLMKGLFQANSIINQFKPDVVIGVGGYASGPIMQLAQWRGITTYLQEQNAYPGITNKILAKKVDKIFCAYDNLSQFFPAEKLLNYGNPVRPVIENITDDVNAAKSALSIEPTTPVVFITGGSLGARTINDALLKHQDTLAKSNIHWIWQCGQLYYDKCKAALNPDYANIQLMAFVKDMASVYAASDVVISRSGALSIAEITAVNKPAILVPSPNVTEDHQTKNAKALTEKQAALLITDKECNEKLVSTAIELAHDEDLRLQIQNKLQALKKPKAAEKIATYILNHSA